MNANTDCPRISAANIRVRKPPAADATPLDALRRLDKDLASIPNKNDRVIALIAACISGGIREPKAIASTIALLGYNYKHVWIQLNHGMGSSPDRHRWWRDVDGNLNLHV